ncbi:MAG: hypothetical protein ACE5NL_01035 [Candidatus Hydrothermarchaeaceae archaeon]
MAEKGSVDRELKVIAGNIGVFIGRDASTDTVLKQMGLKQSNISATLRNNIKKVQDILLDTNTEPLERVESAKGMLSKLSKNKRVPSKIRDMILTTAIDRLEDIRDKIKLEKEPEKAEMASASYTLDLFLSDDKKTQLKLKKMGIVEVPEIVKQVAAEAQKVLQDKNLSERERATKAADVLMEPLQPAITGDRARTNILTLSHEIKTVLWEIANDFVYSAAKVK